MFGSYRNGTYPPFGGPNADDFWGDLEATRKTQVRQAVKLVLVIALLVVLAILVHPGFLVFAGMLSFLLAVELVLVRVSRPTGRVLARVTSPTTGPSAVAGSRVTDENSAAD